MYCGHGAVSRLRLGFQPARPCVTPQVASKLSVYTISLGGTLFISYPTPGVYYLVCFQDNLIWLYVHVLSLVLHHANEGP